MIPQPENHLADELARVIDRLREQLAAETRRADEAERRVKQWRVALLGLTPGGSEYASNPDACAEYVRGMKQAHHDTSKRLAAECSRMRLMLHETALQAKGGAA